MEPLGFDRAQAARLAAGADQTLENMRVVRTLGEALDDCVEVVMTTGRELAGAIDPAACAQRLISAPGVSALVFGDEVRGLANQELRRASAVSTIPTAGKSSLNLAQAVMVYGYEILRARRGPLPPAQPAIEPLADERLLMLLRDRARSLLLAAGFLNRQEPDRVLDELMSLLRRARPSRREVEMLLGAAAQLERNRLR